MGRSLWVNAAFKTLRVSGVSDLSSAESALNTLSGLSLQFCAQVKKPESSEFTSQRWTHISLSLH